MKLPGILFSLLLACGFSMVYGQAENTAEMHLPVWREISGYWNVDDNKISPVITENKPVKDYILIRDEVHPDSRWNNLQLELKFEESSTNTSAGFVLNTHSADDFGFLRIRKSAQQSFLQAGVWRNNAFRTSMNVELEEQIVPGRWYT